MQHQFIKSPTSNWKCAECGKDRRSHPPDENFSNSIPQSIVTPTPTPTPTTATTTTTTNNATTPPTTPTTITTSTSTTPTTTPTTITTSTSTTPTTTPTTTTIAASTTNNAPTTTITTTATINNNVPTPQNPLNQQNESENRYTWENGDYYIGELHSSLFHDVNGKWVCHNGCKYEGEFYNGSFSGVGKYTDIDGTIHHGLWKEDFPCGDCVRYLPEGHRLVGSVKWLHRDRPDSDGAERMFIEFNCHSNSSNSFQEIWYEGRRQVIPSNQISNTPNLNQVEDVRLLGLRNEIAKLQSDLEKSLESQRRTEKQLKVCHSIFVYC